MYLSVYGAYQLIGLGSIFVVCWYDATRFSSNGAIVQTSNYTYRLTLVHIIAKSGMYLHHILLRAVFSWVTTLFSLIDSC